MRKTSILLSFFLSLSVAVYAQERVDNIILLIGDGMGLSSVSMMQLENRYEPTIFDHAENIALQRTYSLDNRVTDSAASGTALANGAKTNNTYLGMTPDGEALESLTEVAARTNRATGLIATTYIQHATPAAFYATTESRHNYHLISKQLLASDIDLVVGGGLAFYKELYGDDYVKHFKESGFGFVPTMEMLRGERGNRRFLALLADKEVGENSGSYLAEATTEALRILEKRGEQGFVLMVEGSLIDGMGHGNDAKAQQREMHGFMQAIEVAVKYAEEHPSTLVVVTSDHETGGLSLVSANSDFNLAEQGVEYRWTTGGHSATMVPIYLYGASAESINGIMENSELGAKLKSLLE